MTSHYFQLFPSQGRCPRLHRARVRSMVSQVEAPAEAAALARENNELKVRGSPKLRELLQVHPSCSLSRR